MVPDYASTCGAIPSSLFTGIKSIHGLAKIHNNVKRRLTSVSIGTITNPTYASYCFDKLPCLSIKN